MKCKCGNEQGKPRVKPFPVSFVDSKSKDVVHIYFNAGFIGSECYFCAVNTGQHIRPIGANG